MWRKLYIVNVKKSEMATDPNYNKVVDVVGSKI